MKHKLSASQRGLHLEWCIQQGLRSVIRQWTRTNRADVRAPVLWNEAHIRQRWGASFNGVDHLCAIDDHLFLLQDKWLSKPVDQVAISQFIVCCQRIEKHWDVDPTKVHRVLVCNAGLTMHAKASCESAGVSWIVCDSAVEDLALVVSLMVCRTLNLPIEPTLLWKAVQSNSIYASLWEYGRRVGLPLFERFETVQQMAHALDVSVSDVCALLQHKQVPSAGIVRFPLRQTLALHFLEQIGWEHTGKADDIVSWDDLCTALAITGGTEGQRWALMRSLPGVREPAELHGTQISLEGIRR